MYGSGARVFGGWDTKENKRRRQVEHYLDFSCNLVRLLLECYYCRDRCGDTGVARQLWRLAGVTFVVIFKCSLALIGSFCMVDWREGL